MATNGQSVLFPLEEVLRKIAHHKNSYVVGLLDCTRDEQPADNWRGIDKLPGEAMKIHQLLVESGADTDVDKHDKVSNLVLTYGCPPSMGDLEKPSIASAYLRFLKM